MAEGWGPTAGNNVLDTQCALYPWVKLHVGQPGADGTLNPAVETTRKQVTEAAASGGTKASSATLVWTSVAGTEDFTHFSRRSLETGGVFGFSGSIVANPVTAGDTFSIAAGAMTTTVPLATTV